MNDDQAQKPIARCRWCNEPINDKNECMCGYGEEERKKPKPDASPREWLWIGVLDGLDLGECKTRLIEKSAYHEQKKEIEALMRNECGCLDDLAAAEAERDALSARVAELTKELEDNEWAAEKILSEQLSAAKVEIERLKEFEFMYKELCK